MLLLQQLLALDQQVFLASRLEVALLLLEVALSLLEQKITLNLLSMR